MPFSLVPLQLQCFFPPLVFTEAHRASEELGYMSLESERQKGTCASRSSEAGKLLLTRPLFHE